MFSFAAWTLIAMGKAKYERKNHPTQDTQMASHIPCRILVHCSCTDKRETYQQPYSSVNSGYWHWWMAKHPFQRLRTLVRTINTVMWYCRKQPWPRAGSLLWLLGGMARDGLGAWGLLWAGLAMADGSPRHPPSSRATLREAASSRQGLKLTPQLSVFVPPAPVLTSSPHCQITISCALFNQLGWEEKRTNKLFLMNTNKINDS